MMIPPIMKVQPICTIERPIWTVSPQMVTVYILHGVTTFMHYDATVNDPLAYSVELVARYISDPAVTKIRIDCPEIKLQYEYIRNVEKGNFTRYTRSIWSADPIKQDLIE